jgi:hypothetical protein
MKGRTKSSRLEAQSWKLLPFTLKKPPLSLGDLFVEVIDGDDPDLLTRKKQNSPLIKGDKGGCLFHRR